MSRADPTRAAEALQAATRELRDALLRDDDGATAHALADREQRLAALAEALEAAGPPGVRLAALLAEARRSDAATLALAQERLGATRRELDQVRHARSVARSLGAETPPARFVDKHV